MKGFVFLGLCMSPFCLAQNVQDSISNGEIEVLSFTKRLPLTKEIINVKKDLDKINLGQDLPYLLKNQTSVMVTSDAGNGIGYTGFRIRGVGGSSINVMLNGIPYNDSESQGTFFVNLPDFASSSSKIIIQRGVGTSTNGTAAFGASVNLISKDPEEKFSIKSDNAFGSFNTEKYSTEIHSGKFWKNRLSVMAKVSQIHSDGYIDRAFSNLNSYNFTALFEDKNTEIRFLTFGGKEKTYQAWNGIDKKTWEQQPKFNPAGAIYDASWNQIIGFYDNETDNYQQNHYQFLWKQNINKNWNFELTLHYTKGDGFYENYKQQAKFSKYNLPNIFINGIEIKKTDFIREKWLDNHFYGGIFNGYGSFKNLDLNFGFLMNQYLGKHFGNVSGVFFPEILNFEYYKNHSIKNENSGFTKGIYKIGKWEVFLDLQYRNIDYTTKILQQGDNEGFDFSKRWIFFNPKAGIGYKIPSGKIYFSYANAHREPNRDDLKSYPETQPEHLHDFETGIEKSFGSLSLSATGYFMYYVNQLVLSGEVNDVGAFIRTNSGKSYRLGAEFSFLAKISESVQINGNATLSRNENLDFIAKTLEREKTPISFSPDFIGNIGIEISPIKKLSFNFQNKWVSSQFLDNTNDDYLKLPGFYLADFGAVYSLPFRNHEASFKLLINNIFNKKYVSNGLVSEGQPYYFSQAGTHFLLGISLNLKTKP